MKNNIFKLVIFLMLPLWMTSCEEKATNEDETPNKAFRPIKFIRSTPFEDEMTFEWVPFANCKYQFEISRDSMDFKTDLKTYTLEGVKEFKLEGLWCPARYSVRMKTISKDGAFPDSEWAYTNATNPTFAMPSLGIIVPNSLVIKIDEVSLRWNPKKKVDRLAILAGTTEVGSFAISEAEQEEGAMTVNIDLAPETVHTARLYYVNVPRGEARGSTPVGPKSVVIADEDKNVLLSVGQKRTLKATVLPEFAISKAVVWSTENTDIVNVNPGTGEVTALSEGVATIKVTTVMNGCEAICTVIVIDIAKNNLLKNGDFATAFSAPPTVNVNNWNYIPKDWFSAYYSNPGDLNRYSTSELARNTDHTNAARLLFWRNLGIATKSTIFRFNEGSMGGIFQDIPVTTGHEYIFRFDFAFYSTGGAQYTEQMESVKILKTDGTKFMEFPLPTNREYTVFGLDPVPNGKAGYFEVTGRFTAPAGVTELRFQLDRRSNVEGKGQFPPREYIHDCSLIDMTDFLNKVQ